MQSFFVPIHIFTLTSPSRLSFFTSHIPSHGADPHIALPLFASRTAAGARPQSSQHVVVSGVTGSTVGVSEGRRAGLGQSWSPTSGEGDREDATPQGTDRLRLRRNDHPPSLNPSSRHEPRRRRRRRCCCLSPSPSRIPSPPPTCCHPFQRSLPVTHLAWSSVMHG
jgi:hypothetical protein